MQAVPWVRSRLLHGMQTRGLAKKRGWGSNWIGTKGTEKKL